MGFGVKSCSIFDFIDQKIKHCFTESREKVRFCCDKILVADNKNCAINTDTDNLQKTRKLAPLALPQDIRPYYPLIASQTIET